MCAGGVKNDLWRHGWFPKPYSQIFGVIFAVERGMHSEWSARQLDLIQIRAAASDSLKGDGWLIELGGWVGVGAYVCHCVCVGAALEHRTACQHLTFNAAPPAERKKRYELIFAAHCGFRWSGGARGKGSRAARWYTLCRCEREQRELLASQGARSFLCAVRAPQICARFCFCRWAICVRASERVSRN